MPEAVGFESTVYTIVSTTYPNGGQGEIRTLNPFQAKDFKSLMYTVPTLALK
jgi:hypothetical protein